MLQALVVIASMVVSASQEAPLPAGTWKGGLSLPTTTLGLELVVAPMGDVVLNVPQQGAKDIPVEMTALEDGSIRFQVPSVGASFEGRLSSTGKALAGRFVQNGVDFPIVFELGETAISTAPSRPQTPVPPFPYTTTEVEILTSAPGVRLTGSYVRPDGAGPVAAVLLISGSGQQDRDATIAGHQPFLLLADALARSGIATLRMDDRGVGGSVGPLANLTTEDFAADAEASLSWLAGRPELSQRSIGLIGHSEGALIAELIAARSDSVAWVATISGPSVPGRDLLVAQSRNMQLAAGMEPADADSIAELQATLVDAVLSRADDEPAARQAVELILEEAGVPEGPRRIQAQQLTSAWVRWFIGYDPAQALGSVTVPMLALYGAKDTQVDPTQNATRLAQLKPDTEIIVFPRLNHLLQTASSGLPGEYPQLEQTMEPEAIAHLVRWILAQSASVESRMGSSPSP